jgi:FkbM family methyltransferase
MIVREYARWIPVSINVHSGLARRGRIFSPAMINSIAMMRSFLPRALGLIPPKLRQMIIGRSDQPSRIATVLHKLVNYTAPDSTEPLPCHGPLRGFRMTTDWTRYRGYIYGNWEPVATQAILSHAQPGMCAFDIGAHLGYYSLLLAKCVGPVGRVVSFEAAPENFSTLQRNILINNLENVELINLAAYSESRMIGMSVSPTDAGSGDWSISRRANGDSIQVQTISIDQFCEANQVLPDFLKIDVEGAEHDVLMGGRETIGRNQPTMLIELHHFDGDLAANRVPDLLSKWNYRFQWLEKWSQTSQILAQPCSTKPFRG